MEKKQISIGYVDPDVVQRFRDLQVALYPGKFGKLTNTDLFRLLISLGEEKAGIETKKFEIKKTLVLQGNTENLFMAPAVFKGIRQGCGLSQMKLKTVLGISQGMITNYENGYMKIPENIAKKMLEIEKENGK